MSERLAVERLFGHRREVTAFRYQVRRAPLNGEIPKECERLLLRAHQRKSAGERIDDVAERQEVHFMCVESYDVICAGVRFDRPKRDAIARREHVEIDVSAIEGRGAGTSARDHEEVRGDGGA